MKRLIAGDGRVARALAASLAGAGVPVERWSRGQSEVPRADEILVAVSDSSIGEVASRMVAAQPTPPVMLHCAGALPSADALAVVRSLTRGIGLVHPLRALSGGESSLSGTVFGIEGDAVGIVTAQSWVTLLGGNPLLLTAAQLGRYHAAAVLVANHAVGLVDAARALLTDAGLDSTVAVRALGQLLASSADNIVNHGLPAALTGPIARGDIVVVARHLAELAGRPEAALYRQTARRVLDVARALGRAPAASLDAIAAILADVPDVQ